MKIIYIGNFRPRHSTENHLAATLEELGHDVIRLQEDTEDRGTLVPTILAAKPDLFMFTRTWGNLVDHELLSALRTNNIPSVSYHLDLYYGIGRESGILRDPFWRTDFVFTPDGGHAAEFTRDGINHFYLRPGVFKRECYPGIPRDHFKYDVIFVGSDGSDYHNEWPYRRQLIEFLRETYGNRFHRFGNGDIVVRNQDLNDLYASAKIVVGDSLCVGFNHPHYWSDRVYETIGRGGFMIHPEIEGMRDELEGGEHLAYYHYGDFQELQAAIEFYLERDDLRNDIRKRGQAFVRENCSYSERLQEMFKILKAQGAIQ